MKQKKKFSISRQKSYLTAGVITLVAVIAMAGIYNRDKKSDQAAEQEAIVMAETERVEETDTQDTEETDSSDNASETPTNGADADSQTEKQSDTVDSENSDLDHTEEEENVETITQAEEPQLHFSAADSIGWPINGDVVLNYSMDKSVYFATLDQYKYNPAVIISGEVNDKVLAAADGQVISVDTNAETGQTVTIGLGDGYQAIYGQLKEVQLSAGDYVSRGDTVGFISEPTKYYSVEGSNLYFAMTKDGQPVDPLDYFD